MFSACKKEGTQPDHINKTRLADITSDNTTITLWSDGGAIQTGYNKLYVSLKNSQGNDIKDATVTYTPMMDMISMKHSSPAEQPVYNSELQLYEGAVVFTMPTSEMGAWQLDVAVNSTTVSFPLTISAAPQNQLATFVGTDENKYVLALVPPLTWQVGLNDLDILINRQTSMTAFPADDGFTIEFTPEMPSMGHGSPNNVHPVSTGSGHYKGKVNYTMTGDWRLHFKLKKNDVVIAEDAYVDILF
ncbi:FixH family protein [Agriterribacter sp.]|uniref:FixH family protein n=1 Tax=Agriterribacter sp. TaxID=2821509 RepID=UPI002CF48E81|nr:FixH family protein [Agriterribacter sp.]HRP57432.1 FixH family protein [Agriterribacter sp.]